MSNENSSGTQVKERKTKSKSKQEELEKEIEILEPVAKAVDRELTHPDGTKKTFVQHELAFFPKLKFVRLLSGTLRLSAQEESGSAGAFLAETLSGLQNTDTENMASEFLTTILAFAELAPDFLEEAIILALNVKPEDQLWATEAIQNIDDELGMDIIEVFVAQNGVALRDFFSKRLPKIGKRLNNSLGLDQEKSETTA